MKAMFLEPQGYPEVVGTAIEGLIPVQVKNI